jgi:hypothetical protein
MNNFIGFFFHGKLGKKTYWEIQLLGILRDYKDGITFFEFDINWDRYESEHTPAIQINLTIFNVFNGFTIYKSNPSDDYEN